MVHQCRKGNNWQYIIMGDIYSIINPRRACAARVTVLALCVCLSVRLSVCLSVCLSVTALAATAFVSACNEWHLRHYYRLFLDLSSWIFEKTFRSKVMV